MPVIIIKSTTIKPPAAVKEQVHELVEEVLSKILKKSRDYVMSILEFDQSISFAGKNSTPSSYVEIKNIGKLTQETTEALSREITNIISKNFEVRPERVYIEFQQSERHMWGWNGGTFA